MARHDAPNWHDCTKMILLLSLFVHGIEGQRVKVEPEVLSYPGQTVNLRCAFSDPTGIQLTQVSWIYEPKEGERINIAVYHPNFGANYPDSPQKGRVSFTTSPPTLASPAIQITDVKMSDEGKYVCEYATYPIGNEQGITSLVMLAKPQNTASTVTVVAGEKTAVVARCESADGRPAAQISWVTTAAGNATTVNKAGGDNTVTVTSEYKLVPKATDNGKDISCVVSHRTLTKPESFKMKLAVEFPPQVTVVGYDNNWYVGRTNVVLTCQATGNPIPTLVTWKTLTGEIPDTVVIDQNKLTVLKVDESVNNTFVCEVKNRLGVGKDQVTAVVREPSVNPSNAGVVAGAVIGSLLALLLVAALVAVLITRSRRQQQQQQGGYRSGGGASDLKSRFGFGGGKKTSKNGTGAGGNNNGPIYVYSEGAAEKNNHHPHSQPLTAGAGGRAEAVPGAPASTPATPTAQDILLSNELDEAERRKFDELELEDEEAPGERYDHFGNVGGGGGVGVGVGAPILQLRPPHDQEDMMGGYLDDDMESQRDGSVISRTAVYV